MKSNQKREGKEIYILKLLLLSDSKTFIIGRLFLTVYLNLFSDCVSIHGIESKKGREKKIGSL